MTSRSKKVICNRRNLEPLEFYRYPNEMIEKIETAHKKSHVLSFASCQLRLASMYPKPFGFRDVAESVSSK